MQIRAVTPADINGLIEIDATIESSQYIHVERNGEGLDMQWTLEERPLRSKLIDRNRPTEESQFSLKQIAGGIDDGIALLAEHDGAMVALLLAQPNAGVGTMRLLDVRVDSDYRRQGLATAMIYQVITEARNRELRAVMAETQANNIPASRLLGKLAFDLAGIDTKRHSNHDLVKESATLLWYAALD